MHPRSALVVVGVLVWPFVYFWRATLGQIVVWPHDGLIYSFPMKWFAARALLAGEVPLWNPYVYAGFPLFAGMQTGVLFPGLWLFCLLDPLSAANLQMILTYSLAGLGTFIYARRLGCTRFAAAFGACTFATGGFMIAHVGHVPMPQGMATLPWLLWIIESLRSGVRFRAVASGAAVLAAALLAGYPPGPMYLLLIGGSYAAAIALFTRPPGGAMRFLIGCAAAVGLGVGLAAVQLVPAIELARQSARASMSFTDFVQYSLPPRQLPMLLFPFLFGGAPPAPYWGAWNIWELSGYVGAAPWMLAAAACTLVRRRRVVAFWLAVCGFGLLLVIGPATPVAWLMFHVPGYNLFRAQARNLFEVDFAVAMLAALALSAVSRRALVAGAAAIALLAALIAVVAVTAGEYCWGSLAVDTKGPTVGAALIAELTPANPAIWIPFALSAASGLALTAVARRRTIPRCTVLLAVQLAALGYYGHGLSGYYPSASRMLARPWLVQQLDGVPLAPATERVALLGQVGASDLNPILWGVPMVNGYDPFILTRYSQLAGGLPYWGAIQPATAVNQPLFLDLLNVRWVVLAHPARAQPPPESALLLDTGRWALRSAADSSTVLENRRGQPRAWLVGETVALAPEQILAAVRDGHFADGTAFDPARVALIEDGPGRRYGDLGPGAEATITSYAAEAIELTTRADSPAFLVASEIDYPGWQATVDGVPAAITRTNYALRGIEVGAGEHRVRMVFAPRSVVVGAALTTLTACAMAVAGLFSWRRGRVQRRSAR